MRAIISGGTFQQWADWFFEMAYLTQLFWYTYSKRQRIRQKETQNHGHIIRLGSFRFLSNAFHFRHQFVRVRDVSGWVSDRTNEENGNCRISQS